MTSDDIVQRAVEILRRRQRFWDAVPTRPYLMILGAVFCIFSTLGFVTDIRLFGQLSAAHLLLLVFLTGAAAVAWALTITRSLKFFPLALVLFVLPGLSTRPITPSLDLTAARQVEVLARLQLDTAGLTAGVMMGYVLFIAFIVVEGRRYMRVHAEIALAREIHQLLVPPIDRSLGCYEFFGASLASGEVGGDLVDLVELQPGWVACIADVSGHGVASGTLMGIFKSATRSRFAAGDSLDVVLADVNRVVSGLKKPGMFVTCAFLAYEADDTLRFTVAGHPPILHYRRASGVVDTLSVAQLPIAMFETGRYTSASVHVDPADLFALVSDGLTEVFDRGDKEFGLAGLEQVFAANADRPLPDVFRVMMDAVHRHGTQLDDQSLLLVRRSPSAPASA